MKVYLISLPEDELRRQVVRKRFDGVLDSIEIVDGVRLIEKKQVLVGYGVRALDDRLTLSEAGCALSHLIALKRFLASGEPYCLILEDDVIGTKEHVHSIMKLMESLPADTFLLCGGQQGLRGEAYNYGRRTAHPGVYFIPKFVRKFYTRACCYVVTRASAETLLKKQLEFLSVSDNWGKYLYEWKNFYFTKQISHPTDLKWSHIENERRANKPKGELARIQDDGARYVLSRFFSKFLLKNFSVKLGLEKIQ